MIALAARPSIYENVAVSERAVIAVEPGFDFAAAEYAELFDRSDATAFQHPLWLQSFYRELAPHFDAEKLVVTGRGQQSGQLLFVLPLLRRRRMGVTLIEAAHLGVGDYAHPVVDRDWHPQASLASEVANALPWHDVLNIRPLRPEAIAPWRRFFARAATQRLDYSAHEARLSAPFEKWRESALDGSFARYLDRKKKRFFKAGNVELTRLRDPAEISGAVETIAKVRKGRFEGDILQKDFARTFYTAVANGGSRDGVARTYRLSLDDETAALVFGLTHGGRFYYLLIGADYERFGKHSPGLVIYDLLIAQWIEEGGKVFDFTIGDESFKADFGTTAIAIHALVEARTLRGRLATAAYGRIQDMKKRSQAIRSKWGRPQPKTVKASD